MTDVPAQNIPLRITIPVPIMPPRPRGWYGKKTSTKLDNYIKVRIATPDWELIMKEAETLGISAGEFVRHCALQSALQLQQHRERDEHHGHDR